MSTAPAATHVKKSKSDDPEHSAKAMRETIESIVIAIILAFLFRTFEAEAFVIPTGSMAPTLQGRHKDVECPQCAYRYRTGASDEEKSAKAVVGTVCPICRYTHVVDPA
ncbi:MAG TPA: S26 family signal peptidase, partial [Pirellulaceae bacterium]|nr:S26 family signal peptidase [Pirellulaceae bacterium]